MPRSTILIPVIVVLVHPPVIRQRLPNSTMVSFSPCNTLLRRPKLRPADSKRESSSSMHRSQLHSRGRHKGDSLSNENVVWAAKLRAANAEATTGACFEHSQQPSVRRAKTRMRLGTRSKAPLGEVLNHIPPLAHQPARVIGGQRTNGSRSSLLQEFAGLQPPHPFSEPRWNADQRGGPDQRGGQPARREGGGVRLRVLVGRRSGRATQIISVE